MKKKVEIKINTNKDTNKDTSAKYGQRKNFIG